MKMRGVDFTTEVDFNSEEEVLRVALENELKGRSLYLQYAKTVKNTLVKRIFVHLAKEELVHIENIKKVRRSMLVDEALDLRVVREGSVEKTKVFFGKLVDEFKERIEHAYDDEKSIQVGMEIERIGYEYYKKASEATRKPAIRKFLRWLMGEEQSHFMLLRNSLDYAKNPESWFSEQEHWLLEG